MVDVRASGNPRPSFFSVRDRLISIFLARHTDLRRGCRKHHLYSNHAHMSWPESTRQDEENERRRRRKISFQVLSDGDPLQDPLPSAPSPPPAHGPIKMASTSTSKTVAQVQAEGDFAIKPQSVAPALGKTHWIPSSSLSSFGSCSPSASASPGPITDTSQWPLLLKNYDKLLVRSSHFTPIPVVSERSIDPLFQLSPRQSLTTDSWPLIISRDARR
jgi:hypothetical protein